MSIFIVWYDTKAVCKKYNVSSVTLWRRVKQGTFPKPVNDGYRNLWNDDDFEKADARLEATRETA